MLGGFQLREFGFIADNPVSTLFHYRQKSHMDFWFMALFNYAEAIGITWTMKKEIPDDDRHALCRG